MFDYTLAELVADLSSGEVRRQILAGAVLAGSSGVLAAGAFTLRWAKRIRLHRRVPSWLAAAEALPRWVTMLGPVGFLAWRTWRLFMPMAARASDIAPAPQTASEEGLEPVSVIDERNGLEWRLLREPDKWLQPSEWESDEGILDGPFHADPSCLARMKTKYFGSYSEQVIEPNCPRCRQSLFSGDLPYHDQARADVLEELRRMARLNKLALTQPVKLEHANYWSKIKPSRKHTTALTVKKP